MTCSALPSSKSARKESSNCFPRTGPARAMITTWKNVSPTRKRCRARHTPSGRDPPEGTSDHRRFTNAAAVVWRWRVVMRGSRASAMPCAEIEESRGYRSRRARPPVPGGFPVYPQVFRRRGGPRAGGRTSCATASSSWTATGTSWTSRTGAIRSTCRSSTAAASPSFPAPSGTGVRRPTARWGAIPTRRRRCWPTSAKKGSISRSSIPPPRSESVKSENLTIKPRSAALTTISWPTGARPTRSA